MKNNKLRQEEGVPPRDSQLNVRIDPELRRKLRVCAAMDNASVQEWIRKIVEAGVSKRLDGVKLPFDQPATPFSICGVG